MLLTWQAFVLQDHVKDLPLTEQKRQFLAHQLEYDNMLQQRRLILENANASSNASGAGGGGGGTFVGDLMIQLFCWENYGDGWAPAPAGDYALNIIHPTKGIIDFGFDALNGNGSIPPWERADFLSTEILPGLKTRNNKEVLSITIIERNIPYPTQQYGTNLVTGNYSSETSLSVMAGWSPYPNRNKFPRMNVVSCRGSFADFSNANFRGFMTPNYSTFNDMFTIPKFDGGSTGTLDYSSPVNSYLRNFRTI